MIQNKKAKKTNFIKKIFIKISRIFGYEIIDQGRYEIPTLDKNLDETLSIPGKKSITIPEGEYMITRKIKSLKIIFRTCTSQLIMDQNKKRLFEKDKNEYTFRSLNSLLKSTVEAKKKFNNINFEIIVTDTNSNEKDLTQIKMILVGGPEAVFPCSTWQKVDVSPRARAHGVQRLFSPLGKGSSCRLRIEWGRTN